MVFFCKVPPVCLEDKADIQVRARLQNKPEYLHEGITLAYTITGMDIDRILFLGPKTIESLSILFQGKLLCNIIHSKLWGYWG